MRKSEKLKKSTSIKKSQSYKTELSRRISTGQNEFSISPEIVDLIMDKYKKSIIICHNDKRCENIIKTMISKHKYIMYYHWLLRNPLSLKEYRDCYADDNTDVFNALNLDKFNSRTCKKHNVFLNDMPKGIKPSIVIIEDFVGAGNHFYEGYIPKHFYMFGDKDMDSLFELKNPFYHRYLDLVDWNVLKI